MKFELVNIESRGGTSTGIAITDAETGAPIPGVIEADVAIRPDAPIKARLTLSLVRLKLQAGPVFFVYDPRTGARKRVAKIVYEDGQVFEPGAE